MIVKMKRLIRKNLSGPSFPSNLRAIMPTKLKQRTWGGHLTIRQIYIINGIGGTGTVYGDAGGNADITIISDGSMPSYKSRIRRRETATTHLSASGLSFEHGAFGAVSDSWSLDPDYGNGSDYYLASGTLVDLSTCLPGPIDSGLIDGLENVALMNFISKANRVTRQFQAGVFLGELRETVHQIRHPAEALRKGLSNYLSSVKKRAKILRASRSLANGRRAAQPGSRGFRSSVRQMISGTWLEYNFGWLPLVSDIRSGALALARYQSDRFPSKVVIGRAIARGPASVGIRSGASITGNVKTLVKYSTQAEVKIYGAVKCTTGASVDHALALSGLTWRDFAPTVWELIPYSFLVDYFANIGAIVEAASFNNASVAWVNIGTYERSVSEQIEQQYEPFPSPNGHWFRQSSHMVPSGPFRFERFSKSRSRYIGGFMPSLTFKLPGSHQSLNVSALLGQSRSIARSLR